jgi:hypothetical protein
MYCKADLHFGGFGSCGDEASALPYLCPGQQDSTTWCSARNQTGGCTRQHCEMLYKHWQKLGKHPCCKKGKRKVRRISDYCDTHTHSSSEEGVVEFEHGCVQERKRLKTMEKIANQTSLQRFQVGQMDVGYPCCYIGTQVSSRDHLLEFGTNRWVFRCLKAKPTSASRR